MSDQLVTPEELLNQQTDRPAHDLTGFQRDCLATVGRLDAPKGLEVKEALEAHYGDVNHGRLYPNLDTLVEKALVRKTAKDRRTNEYQITGRGRDVLVSNILYQQGGVADE